METFLISAENLVFIAASAFFTFFDVVNALVFIDAFGTRRKSKKQYFLIACINYLCCLAWNTLYSSLLGLSFFSKIAVLSAINCITYRLLYPSLSRFYLVFLTVLQYLLNYFYSFIFALVFSALCGVTIEQFYQWEYALIYIISGLVCCSSELGLTLAFRKLYRRKKIPALHPFQMSLHFAFPAASVLSLAALLRLTHGQTVRQGFLILCCTSLLLANAAVFFLLHRVDQAAKDREKLVTLDQQLRMQTANLESARGLYETQRKTTHEFRAQWEILDQLLAQKEYDAARNFLQSAAERTSERLTLVDCRHPVLNALFNTKAEAAVQKQIDIRFDINDLSGLDFEPADLAVLLANLLDNAIEACEKCPQPRVIEVRAAKEDSFFFSIRNTSLPVAIQDGHIPTTKPDPRLHGFGLANVKAILKKHRGVYAMEYRDGWFQFAGELPLS